ncbi:MAG: tRNA pseudouridine(55) synthase TruB [Deltaproteobacteria bacterium]|nr:tRNA pseudouridine(55) synthase TruB [Deltaproteobacteria bacterium]
MNHAFFCGVLLVDKPAGPSSFAIIARLRQLFAQQTGLRPRELPKLGHAGTLDPFATGLLPIFVGPAVRLAEYFLGAPKRYEGVIRFGAATASGDCTDPVIRTSAVLPAARAIIQTAADTFVGDTYWQRPPMHSAKKRDGQPLYVLARQGVEVERAPVACTISGFTITAYSAPEARFQVACSAGTYIRVLAQDLAQSLGTVGMLTALRRVGVGKFDGVAAWTLEQIAAALAANQPLATLPCAVPFDQLLDHWPRIAVDAATARALGMGQQHVLASLQWPEQPAPHVALYHADALLAIAVPTAAGWRCARVFTAARS